MTLYNFSKANKTVDNLKLPPCTEPTGYSTLLVHTQCANKKKVWLQLLSDIIRVALTYVQTITLGIGGNSGSCSQSQTREIHLIIFWLSLVGIVVFLKIPGHLWTMVMIPWSKKGDGSLKQTFSCTVFELNFLLKLYTVGIQPVWVSPNITIHLSDTSV